MVLRALCAVAAAALLGVIVHAEGPNVKPPQMYVYTRYPPQHGEPNELICHGSSFYPPKIDISLYANGKELENCHQSDLTFQEDWTYYTTSHIKVNYDKDTEYKCEVRHNGADPKAYVLEKFI